jgi:hypothetical protein
MVVELRYVLGQYMFEVAAVEDQYPVEQVVPAELDGPG